MPEAWDYSGIKTQFITLRRSLSLRLRRILRDDGHGREAKKAPQKTLPPPAFFVGLFSIATSRRSPRTKWGASSFTPMPVTKARSPHTLLHNPNLLLGKAVEVVDHAVDFAGRGVQKKIAWKVYPVKMFYLTGLIEQSAGQRPVIMYFHRKTIRL